MDSIEINGKILQHTGLPLAIYILEDGSWGGRTNFLCSNETEKNDADLIDLNDCFYWMKKWFTEDSCQGGYILDFSTKTIYYDTPETLAILQEKKIPKRKWDGYFQTFTQMDFSK